MPIFVYVLLGIALLVFIVLITKVRIFICYEDNLYAYAKIWFFKFKLSAKKTRLPRFGFKSKQKKAPSSTSSSVAVPKKEKSISKKLWEMKTVLIRIINMFLEKVHFRFLKLKINIASDNAAKTALLRAGVTQGVSYIIEILQNISNVDVVNKSHVYVNADFVSQESEFEGKIELYICILPLLIVWIRSFNEYFEYESSKED